MEPTRKLDKDTVQYAPGRIDEPAATLHLVKVTAWPDAQYVGHYVTLLDTGTPGRAIIAQVLAVIPGAALEIEVFGAGGDDGDAE